VISPETGTINIHVKTTNPGVRCFTVDCNKHIYVSGNRNREENSELQHFVRGVRITLNRDKKPCVKYPDNNIRILAIDEATRAISLWTVSIVNQDQRFFLVIQENGEFQTYCTYDDHDKAVVACPDIERWESLIMFLNNLIDPESLLGLNEYKAPEKKNGKPVLAGNEGYVLWFSDAENIGVIETVEGAARVHWSAIARSDSRRAFFKPGEKVTFTKLISPNNTRVGRSSTFRFEAAGVTVIEPKQ
jgi:cold shock CspA family protein